LLWHRISQNLSIPFQNLPIEEIKNKESNKDELILPLTANNNIVIIEDYQVSKSRTNVIEQASSPLLKKQIDFKIPLTTTESDTVVFDFDEEPEKPKFQETELKEEEEIEENYKSTPKIAYKVSTDLFGTSLPISINRNTNKEVVQKEILSEEVASNSPEDLSKSFDVPMSLNYRAATFQV